MPVQPLTRVDSGLWINHRGYTFHDSYKATYRSWERTPGYGNVSDLPVNPYQTYSDYGTVLQRNDRKTYYSDGTPVVTSGNEEWGWSGSDMSSENVYQASLLALQFPAESVIRNELIVDCLGKAADAKVNLPVLFAESRKTSDLIYSSASRVYNAYRSFRRGDLRGVAENLNITPKKLHKSWLEYKYGWMPILQDVKGAAEFFAQQHVGKPLRFSVQSTRVLSEDFEQITQSAGVSSQPDVTTRRGTGNRTYRVKIWLEVSNQHLSAIQQLGLTNPALVAWELVPFSFVFDWFISVGDYLKGLTALQGLSVRKALWSMRQDQQFTFDWHSPASNISGGYVTAGRFKFVGGTKDFHRFPLVVDPLAVYPPVNRDPFSWNRLITGLALYRAKAR